MTEMVEKIARSVDEKFPMPGLGVTEAIVRLVLEEMREPTEEMKKAGAFRYRDIPLGNGTSAQGMALGDDPINSYRKMIDAAMKEE